MPSPLILLGAAELVVSEEEFIAPDQFRALWDREERLTEGEAKEWNLTRMGGR